MYRCSATKHSQVVLIESEVLVLGKSQVKICCAEINSVETDKWQLVVIDLHEVIQNN